MSRLNELAQAGKIRVKALIYVNCPGAMEVFLEDMRQAGADVSKLVAGKHYDLNHTRQTEFLRPYTGEVWIDTKPDTKLMREVMPMMLARESHPKITPNEFHAYNIPLFCTCVRLGAVPAVMPNGFVSFDDISNECEDLVTDALERLIQVSDELVKVKAEESQWTQKASVMRNAKMRVTASEYARNASKARARREALESDAEMITLAYAAAPVAVEA